MSPDERKLYEQRRRAMRPRSPTERARERHDREAAELLNRAAPTAPATPEGEWLRAEMKKLDAEQTQLEAELASHSGAAEQNTGSHNDR